MDYINYTPIIGIILNITRGNDCCSQMIMLQTENGIVNFVVDSDTYVIENRQLRQGMRVAAFYDSSAPVPMIFPPQYRAKIVAVLGRNEEIMLNYFDSELVAGDRSLALNIGRNTVIRTANGQSTTCNIGNQVLLVFYTMTTRSIPPQTTPEKIIVWC